MALRKITKMMGRRRMPSTQRQVVTRSLVELEGGCSKCWASAAGRVVSMGSGPWSSERSGSGWIRGNTWGIGSRDGRACAVDGGVLFTGSTVGLGRAGRRGVGEGMESEDDAWEDDPPRSPSSMFQCVFPFKLSSNFSLLLLLSVSELW